MMDCPLKHGFRCPVDVCSRIAISSSCSGCPYINDLDRALIRMDILRRNRRDDAPLIVIPLREVSV